MDNNMIEMTLDEWTDWVATIQDNAVSEEAAREVIQREYDNVRILLSEENYIDMGIQ